MIEAIKEFELEAEVRSYGVINGLSDTALENLVTQWIEYKEKQKTVTEDTDTDEL